MRRCLPAIVPLLSCLLACAAGAQEAQKRQVGQFVLEDVPEWPGALRERMLQYLAVRPTALQSVSDDGNGILITTRFGDTNQLHVVHRPMGARQQVTFFDEPINTADFVPGARGRQLVFARDVGGNEQWQVYELDLQAGRTTMLTDGKSRNESAVVSSDGRRVAWCSTARNGRDFDIYVCERDVSQSPVAASPETIRAPKLLMQVEGMYSPAEFSPDGGKLLVQHYVSEKQTRWFVLDAASGEAEQITPDSPAFFYGGGAWGHDGRSAYFFTDRDGEFRKLYHVEFEYGNWKCLTPDIEWDVEEIAVDPAGKGIAFTTNEDGITRLHFANSDGSGRKTLKLPVGAIYGLTFARNGGVLGFTLNSARAPADAYTATFPGGEVTRWTQSEVGGLNPETFIEAELIRYPTFDKMPDGRPRMIPAFVYRGRGDGRRPVVIHCHGGPESQYTPIFSSVFQHWANELGITVINPNVRGSTGYGRSFHQLDNGVKREDSVRDIGALLDWIAKQPDMDSDRIGIFGGSYGGYMVMGSLINYPGRIKAGINIVGITDFVTFLQNTSEYRRDLRRAEYGDERDTEVKRVLDAISPLRQADRIEAALFVLHGQNDPRVPIGEAQQIVAKMREMQRPVWFANALDEGHGFQKKPNRDLATIMYAVFWQERLLK